MYRFVLNKTEHANRGGASVRDASQSSNLKRCYLRLSRVGLSHIQAQRVKHSQSPKSRYSPDPLAGILLSFLFPRDHMICSWAYCLRRGHTHRQNQISERDSAATICFRGGGEKAARVPRKTSAHQLPLLSAFHTPSVPAQEFGYDHVGGLGMAVSVWISCFTSFASRSLVESATTKIEDPDRIQMMMQEMTRLSNNEPPRHYSVLLLRGCDCCTRVARSPGICQHI